MNQDLPTPSEFLKSLENMKTIRDFEKLIKLYGYVDDVLHQINYVDTIAELLDICDNYNLEPIVKTGFVFITKHMKHEKIVEKRNKLEIKYELFKK